MINKFEAIGISASVAIMALALVLLKIDANNTSVLSVTDTNTQAAAVAVVDKTKANSQQALFDTLSKSVDESGTLNSLVIDDVVFGDGPEVAVGDTVTVHYIGKLQNGQEFDNSNKRGTPFTFTVGEGRVIEGWEKGIIGMKKGGQRVLVIPPQMAYGTNGAGPIPPNATLIFAITLLEIN